MAGTRAKPVQTQTVKVLGITVRRNVQRGIPLKYVRRTPGDVPTRQSSRSLFGQSEANNA